MTIPTSKQVYASSNGTAKIPAFVFSDHDPGDGNINHEMYTGWVNTQTKAIWYLEGLNYASGSATAQWRSVGPIVIKDVAPTAADYLYPLGQAWVNSTALTYWVLVGLTGTTATWEELSSGVASGILTVTGDVGGAVSPDGARNLELRGTPGQINVVGNPAANTLTLALAGGSQAIDSVATDTNVAPGTNPTLPDATGKITVTGAQVASGTTADTIQTNAIAANAYEIQVQRSAASAASNRDLNGVSHFKDTEFSVDSNGYVALLGSGLARFVEVDTSTPPGSDPVLPDPTGTITVTGAQIAPASTADVIQTNSLAANSYEIQIQRSKTEAASTPASNGVAHFDSAAFVVDADGFVTLGGSGTFVSIGVNSATPPGTSPVLPDGSGTVTFDGEQLAAATTANAIQVNSIAANTATIGIQKSKTEATSTPASNGIAHFSSDDFALDSDAFTTLSSKTNYAVVCGGTGTGAELQSIASVGTTGQILTSNGAGALPTFQAVPPIGTLQQVRTSFSTQGMTTAAIPSDATIPQQTEGFELMTLSITPKSASSVLKIEACAFLDSTAPYSPTMALFRDATANALAANAHSGSTDFYPCRIDTYVSSGSTTTTTFKLRIGTSTGSNLYYNQRDTGLQLFGGTFICTMYVTEYSS